ncbi:hypothetical protein D9M68_899460 [compost metagenome]
MDDLRQLALADEFDGIALVDTFVTLVADREHRGASRAANAEGAAHVGDPAEFALPRTTLIAVGAGQHPVCSGVR